MPTYHIKTIIEIGLERNSEPKAGSTRWYTIEAESLQVAHDNVQATILQLVEDAGVKSAMEVRRQK